jgi:cell division protein FtsQ
MPVTEKFTSAVPVASGYIFDKSAQQNLHLSVPFPGDSINKPVLVQLNEVALFLKNNDFWDSQIEQIYVNESNQLELVPRVGNHIILIGSSDDLAVKMNKLMIFYKEGINKTGWDKYSQINLKFKDQVICTKRTVKKNS